MLTFAGSSTRALLISTTSPLTGEYTSLAAWHQQQQQQHQQKMTGNRQTVGISERQVTDTLTVEEMLGLQLLWAPAPAGCRL